MICTWTDEPWAFNTWTYYFKMILESHELNEPTLGLWFHRKCTCLLAQLNLLTSLDWWLGGLCNEQCNVNDLKWKCIYKWEVQIWGATAAPIQSTGNPNGWEQRLSDFQGKQGLNTKNRRNLHTAGDYFCFLVFWGTTTSRHRHTMNGNRNLN